MKENRKWKFPGSGWLNRKMSRKLFALQIALACVCFLLSSGLFLGYLRNYVGDVYDELLTEVDTCADEVYSYLDGSDGDFSGLPEFLEDKEIYCTIEDENRNIVFDNRPDFDYAHIDVAAEREFPVDNTRSLNITVQNDNISLQKIMGFVDWHVRMALGIYIVVLFVIGVTLIYYLVIYPIANLRETMRKYSEEGVLPARSDRKDEIGRLHNTFAELTGILAAKEKTERQIIASISHDIKTPLTSVLGCSERMINTEMTPEKQEQYLHSIYDRAISIKSIVDEFDDYVAAGIKDGKPLQLMTVQELFDIVRSEYADELMDANVQLSFSDSCPNVKFMCNPTHMRRYFGNLIGNSISHSGSVQLKLLIECHIEDGQILVSFSDNGNGVPNELLQQIFEPLFTTDLGRKVSGLGLSICKSIISAHGGHIYAENRTDGGLMIRASLPVVQR